MPMQNLHNWEYDHGKVLEREQHHSSPNHPIPARSGNPVKQLFQSWNLGNLDFRKWSKQGIWGSCCKQKDSNLRVCGLQWEFLTSYIDLWTKITFGNLPLNNFYMQDGQGSDIRKIMKHPCFLGWALSVAKHLFWSPVSHLPWHWSPVLQRQTTMCRLFKLDVFWHFNCKIICYTPPSLNSTYSWPASRKPYMRIQSINFVEALRV